MQELTKLWKEFELSQKDKSSDDLSNGPTLEIRIPAEHVTATNRQVSLCLLKSLLVYKNPVALQFFIGSVNESNFSS